MRTRRELLGWMMCCLLVAGCDKATSVGDAAPTCGTGTALKEGACVARVSCGAGTHVSADSCVPDSAGLSCGNGTYEADGTCIPDSTAPSCGSGTHLSSGTCLADVACGAGTHVLEGQCVPDAVGLDCGTGTHLASGSECVADVVCGSGTHASNGSCLPDSSELSCGDGTYLSAGQCFPDTICGSDTHAVGGVCQSSISCGTGTDLSGTTCQADCSEDCGTGTTWSGTECEVSPPDASFSAFTANPAIAASFFDDNSTAYNYLHQYTFVATDLTQGTADAWAELQTPLIGTGGAIHLSWHHNTNVSVSTTPQTIPVRNATTSSGGCIAVAPDSEPYDNIDGTYVNFFAWKAGVAAPQVCAKAGSVTFVRQASLSGKIEITFNVQFSDGTAWLNKVFYADYRLN